MEIGVFPSDGSQVRHTDKIDVDKIYASGEEQETTMGNVDVSKNVAANHKDEQKTMTSTTIENVDSNVSKLKVIRFNNNEEDNWRSDEVLNTAKQGYTYATTRSPSESTEQDVTTISQGTAVTSDEKDSTTEDNIENKDNTTSHSSTTTTAYFSLQSSSSTKQDDTTTNTEGKFSVTDEKITTPNTNNKNKKCKPVENVVFVKTHKTGSSTILNIIQRYSEKSKLPMVLPRLPEKNHMLGWPYRFNSNNVFEHEAGRRYNLFANHARFSKRQIERVMADPVNTKFVTILREPMRQLESSAVYFKYQNLFNISKDNLVENFLKKTARDRDELWKMTRKPKSSILYLIKNPNTFDLGHRTWVDDDAAVSKILDTVKGDMNLVMISDHMLESLVLLKDELCWELEDVVYFTLNKRPKRFRQKIEDDASSPKRAMLREWNKIDVTLFDHFNATLWRKIRNGGEQFRKDVERLKQMNQDLEKKCLDQGGGQSYDKTQPWFPILGYKIRNDTVGTAYHELCKQLIRPEIEYNNHLRELQSRNGWVVPTKKTS